MKRLVLAGAAGAVAIAAAANAQQRLPRECRQEIRQLCGSDRAELRDCLRERHSELSETCSAQLRERMQERRNGVARGGQRVAQQDFDVISYGAHERQAVDFYPATNADGRPPLILFIHGGGWSFGNRTTTVQHKPKHFTQSGYAFASTGYRLLPEAPVETQAQDVGAAIRKLRANSAELGFDPDRIVLMGHSAGAHLAALVSTDPQYAGDAMGSVQGVILLDGAGYDVAATMAQRSRQARRIYDQAFGSNPARQQALSPVTHVGGPDAPNWLILHVADRAQSTTQSRALAEKLEPTGAKATAVAVPDTDHGRLNRELGSEGDWATDRVDEFLGSLFD